MSDSQTAMGVTRPARRFVRLAAGSGLVGGVVLGLWMMLYYALTGTGFASVFSNCFASIIYGQQGMAGSSMAGSSMAGSMKASHNVMTMGTTIIPSHAVVGGLLNLAVAALVGVAFALALGGLIRAGLPWIKTLRGFVVASTIGGALLYVIMMYAVLPLVDPSMVSFTSHGAFFVGHLLFGATFGLVFHRHLNGARSRSLTPRPAAT